MELNTKYIPKILIIIIIFSIIITFNKTVVQKKFDIIDYHEEL